MFFLYTFYTEHNGQKYSSVRVPERNDPKTIKTYPGSMDPETGRITPRGSWSRPKGEYAYYYGFVRFLDKIQKDESLERGFSYAAMLYRIAADVIVDIG